jgi:hypothetical protein
LFGIWMISLEIFKMKHFIKDRFKRNLTTKSIIKASIYNFNGYNSNFN